MVTAADEEAVWGILTLSAHGFPDKAAFELARYLVTRSGAERAFVAGAKTYGADADGFAITHPEERLDASFVDRTRKHGRLYEDDVAFKTTRGSRLVVVGARGVIVLEHRYQRDAFDALDSITLDRWEVLVDLVFLAPPRAPTKTEERAEVTAALKKTGGNITHAANFLGLSRLGLKKRMVRLGLREGTS